jgi:hypothetical protein
MVDVGLYFCRSRCNVTDSIQEVADITFADYKQFPHYWFMPADSAAFTPEPRPMENDLQHSLLAERGGVKEKESLVFRIYTRWFSGPLRR